MKYVIQVILIFLLLMASDTRDIIFRQFQKVILKLLVFLMIHVISLFAKLKFL